jgi:hypothetical protein
MEENNKVSAGVPGRTSKQKLATPVKLGGAGQGKTNADLSPIPDRVTEKPVQKFEIPANHSKLVKLPHSEMKYFWYFNTWL